MIMCKRWRWLCARINCSLLLTELSWHAAAAELSAGRCMLLCCLPLCAMHACISAVSTAFLTLLTFSVQWYPYEGVTNYCKKDWGETVKFKQVKLYLYLPLCPVVIL